MNKMSTPTQQNNIQKNLKNLFWEE